MIYIYITLEEGPPTGGFLPNVLIEKEDSGTHFGSLGTLFEHIRSLWGVIFEQKSPRGASGSKKGANLRFDSVPWGHFWTQNGA